jgi:hypothetical protein
MKRGENNISGRQNGLLKAAPLINGKPGVLRCGSMANVNSIPIMRSSAVTHYPLISLHSWFR